MPYAIYETYGGFVNKAVIPLFVKFATCVFERYKDKVTYWMTFNEINNQADGQEPLHVWTNSAMIIEEESKKEELVFQAGVNELIASAAAVIEGKNQSRLSNRLYDGLCPNLSLFLCTRRFDGFGQSQ